MTPTCSGHIEPTDEQYRALRGRYGADSIGFVAELAKKNGERRIMHQVLTDAGVPSETPEGRGLCLIARLAIMAERLRSAEWTLRERSAMADVPPPEA